MIQEKKMKRELINDALYWKMEREEHNFLLRLGMVHRKNSTIYYNCGQRVATLSLKILELIRFIQEK